MKRKEIDNNANKKEIDNNEKEGKQTIKEKRK